MAASSVTQLDQQAEISIDHDVLDCSICYEPLKPPIFQCQVGHVACSSCYQKLSNKCPVCSCTTGRNRCFALEKVVESTKVLCAYKQKGCTIILPYYKIKEHEKRCKHAPYFCPYPNCNFSGSKERLLYHIKDDHNTSIQSISYDTGFKVDLASNCSFKILLANDGSLFLLQNRTFNSSFSGNALSVVCIRPSDLKDPEFWYELKIKGNINSLKRNSDTEASYLNLRSQVESSMLEGGLKNNKVFLLIPSDFGVNSDEGVIHVIFRIQKVHVENAPIVKNVLQKIWKSSESFHGGASVSSNSPYPYPYGVPADNGDPSP